MELSFFQRAERILSRPEPRVDYQLLVAALVAHQQQSATAKAARSRAARAGPANQVAEILLGGGGWQEAKRAQRGSFHGGGDSAQAPMTNKEEASD